MIPKLVLTGGPCAGKTTCLQAIARHFGQQVLTVPEAATLLLGAVPRPGGALAQSLEWIAPFQKAIRHMQEALETAHELLARDRGAHLIVCDRGILDGAAYWPGGRSAFLDYFALDREACFARYQKVLHLESLAVAQPERFGTAGNELRYEMLEEATERERCVLAAWQGHPGWEKVAGGDLDAKVARVLEVVGSLLETAPATARPGDGS